MVTIWPLEEIGASSTTFATLLKEKRKLRRNLQAWCFHTALVPALMGGAILSCSTWLPTAAIPWFVLPLAVVESGRSCVHAPCILHQVLTLPNPIGHKRSCTDLISYLAFPEFSTHPQPKAKLETFSVLLTQHKLKRQPKAWSSGMQRCWSPKQALCLLLWVPLSGWSLLSQLRSTGTTDYGFSFKWRTFKRCKLLCLNSLGKCPCSS